MKTFLIITLFPSMLFSQWTQQNFSNAVMLLTADFSSVQNGAIGGWWISSNPEGRIFYTTNSGLNWMLAQIPDSSRAAVKIQFINSLTGYCGGAYNIILNEIKKPHQNSIRFFANAHKDKFFRSFYRKNLGMREGEEYRGLFLKTTNGGTAWFTYGMLPDSVFYLLDIYFLDANTGFASADLYPTAYLGSGILKTTNGGNSWIKLTVPDSVREVRSIYFLDYNTGIGVGYGERAIILRTSNGGLNWSKQNIPSVDNFTSVYFPNSSTGFATGVDTNFIGVVYKTTDTGLNWIRLNQEFPDVILEGNEFVRGSGTGIVYGTKLNGSSSQMLISVTTNYGNSWADYFSNDSAILTGSCLVNSSNWYVTGGDFYRGVVMRSTNGGGTIGIKPISNEVPTGFKLYQNYPNPFNISSKFKIQIPAEIQGQGSGLSNVSVIVYNTLGVEIEILLNTELKPGTYEITWDASNYPSGVYYYRMVAGDFVDTKKMVLIK